MTIWNFIEIYWLEVLQNRVWKSWKKVDIKKKKLLEKHLKR